MGFHFAEQGAEYCTLRELEKENKRKYKKTKKTNHKMADPFQYKNTGNPYNQFTEEKLIRKNRPHRGDTSAVSIMHTKTQADQKNIVRTAFEKTGAYEHDYRARQHQLVRYHGRVKWAVAIAGTVAYALMLRQKQKAIYEGSFGNNN